MSITFEHTEVLGWEHAIRGMRNPMNSWNRSDSHFHFGEVLCEDCAYTYKNPCGQNCLDIGSNDYDLMMRLAKGGPVHAKYRRMITVYVDVTAPLYWWKEFDTYKVGTVANSCSTMHKIHAKEFTLEDFSCEHLNDECVVCNVVFGDHSDSLTSLDIFKYTIEGLNYWRRRYLVTKKKKYWWQMIQLLPSSYNQKRTVMLNYEVLANIYKYRKDHKLDEWAEHKGVIPEIDSTAQAKYARPYKKYFGFCDWIKTLPYSELITGEDPVECEV